MATLLPQLRARYFDANGVPLAGGQLFTYIAGTTTPLATYTDQSGVTPNANPVVLDANGYADVWLGNRFYKFVLQDALGNTLWTVDNVDGSQGNNTSPWASHAVTDGQPATALAGETVDFSANSGAIYNIQITRGTTVFTTGTLAIQNLNGTGRVIVGTGLANEPNGVTFSVSQVGTVCTLLAALSPGLGNGTIKMSRSLVP